MPAPHRARALSNRHMVAAGNYHAALVGMNILEAGGNAVDAGVAPAVEPTLVVDVNRNPDRYDGVSPERVAASSVSTQASDMYALGCMLFERLNFSIMHHEFPVMQSFNFIDDFLLIFFSHAP